MGTEIRIPHGWTARDYQWPLWEYLEKGGTRAVAVWHRRAGKDLFAINRIAKCMVDRPGLYWHCFPTYNQGRKIAWDGFTKAGRKFRDAFPAQLVAKESINEMRIEMRPMGWNKELQEPYPGGIYQVVGSDDPDRLVGANPFGIVFSEWSIMNPAVWDLVAPILAENGGWALFIYTARGHNHGFTLLETAKKNPKRWFHQILTVRDTFHEGKAAVDEKELINAVADGMSPEMIQQEFYCSFEAPLVGAFYGTQMTKAREEGRIGKVPYDPALLVDTWWDLGMNDETVIWFTQTYGKEERIIDYFSDEGEGLAYYAKELGKKPYAYGTHTAPHDITVRELGTGKSRLEVAAKLGIKFRVAPKLEVIDGIEASRNLLNSCWFDEEKCQRGIECMTSYQKVWDEEKKIFLKAPLHNWASHGADAFRTWAVARRQKREERDQKRPSTTQGLDEYNPFQ